MGDRLVDVEIRLTFLEKMVRELDGVMVEFGRRLEGVEGKLARLELLGGGNGNEEKGDEREAFE